MPMDNKAKKCQPNSEGFLSFNATILPAFSRLDLHYGSGCLSAHHNVHHNCFDVLEEVCTLLISYS